jgi:TrmH family RNA methyltransferase
VELGAAIVEGPRMILDLMRNVQTRALVEQVLIREDQWDDFSAQLLALTAHDDDRNPVLLPATEQVLLACTDTITNQGIVARVKIPTLPIPTTQQYPLFIIVDGIQDPGNLGTLIRSCRATGVSGVLLLPGSCDPWNPKAIRSAMGTTFQIPLLYPNSWDDACQQLETLGCKCIFAATMLEGDDKDKEAKQQSHYQVSFCKQATAIVLGSEGNGLTPSVRQALMDQRIRAMYVPMMEGVESLNAAVCGSVILFEYMRQCLETNAKAE